MRVLCCDHQRGETIRPPPNIRVRASFQKHIQYVPVAVVAHVMERRHARQGFCDVGVCLGFHK